MSAAAVPPDPDDGRTRELADRLAAVRARIADAARGAGRDPGGVTLVAVTKFFPAADVVRLAGLGVSEVGENREQEASAKAADVAGLAGFAAAAGIAGVAPAGPVAGPSAPGPVPPALRWHMVGQLQTNKARAVTRWASVVESVDRTRLVGALSRAALADAADAADAAGPPALEVLVQVDLDPEPDARRGGTRPADVPALAEAVAAADGLVLRGLMAVAPRGTEPRPAFEQLAALAARVRAEHPGADRLSAGMSADLEAAVAVGATHVRIGSALLGARPRPV